MRGVWTGFWAGCEVCDVTPVKANAEAGTASIIVAMSTCTERVRRNGNLGLKPRTSCEFDRSPTELADGLAAARSREHPRHVLEVATVAAGVRQAIDSPRAGADCHPAVGPPLTPAPGRDD